MLDLLNLASVFQDVEVIIPLSHTHSNVTTPTLLLTASARFLMPWMTRLPCQVSATRWYTRLSQVVHCVVVVGKCKGGGECGCVWRRESVCSCYAGRSGLMLWAEREDRGTTAGLGER